MTRPTSKDIFGKNATHESVNKMYIDSPNLFKYAQALDNYIDYLEESKIPSANEMREKYTDLREKHGLYDSFYYFWLWINSLANPTNKP